MHISNEILLTLLSLEGFGITSVGVIADYIISNSLTIETIDDIEGLLMSMISHNSIRGISKSNIPVKETLIQTHLKSQDIIKRSFDGGIGIINRYEDAFPKSLLMTVNESGKKSVPLMIYYKGNLEVLENNAISIIGTRHPTKEGLIAADFFASFFSERGFNVISGLAKGCDTAGHLGALKSSNGTTTAVLAHGVDSVYPEENKFLSEKILANGGLLLSEYPIGTNVSQFRFVERDRIQAALSDAVLVIQTGAKGGAMHTAKACIKMKKPLYSVVFHDVLNLDFSLGSRALLEMGARNLSSKNIEEAIETIQNAHINRLNEDYSTDSNNRPEPYQLTFPF